MAVSGNAPDLGRAVDAAAEAIRAAQAEDGHWVWPLEADATISAEYILAMHFAGEIDRSLEAKMASFLRRVQGDDGGWPLYPGASADVSATVKAYYALKLAGDARDAAHMRRARERVLALGGAARANVFTRITLALFAQVPWRAVPYMPAEIVLLPRWFPFHLSKVSYWSRTVMVPLTMLYSLRARAANPDGVGVTELFTVAPDQERRWFPVRSPLNWLLTGIERVARRLDVLVPAGLRARARATAEAFVADRLEGSDGALGAIFPAMTGAYMMFVALRLAPDHPQRVATRDALRSFVVEEASEAWCQPCVSPVWDTGLACAALQQAERRGDGAAVTRGLDWLAARQLRDEPGDWQWRRPDLAGGGWPFEYRNDAYPDIDDTPLIAWTLLDSGLPRFGAAVERAAGWVVGMQSSNGGWASFDVDNTHSYLNEIPFADHGALLDPPTADVTARCVTFLAKYDAARFAGPIERALAYLRAEQTRDGAWFGRWGTHYLYGTWSVLTALMALGLDDRESMVTRAAAWLRARQRDDGGWGETNDAYFDPSLAGRHDHSTAFQTAWALSGLVSAGDADSEACARGAAYLVERQQADGLWYDRDFTAPGFPRVFYLKYHGYTSYFPLWALAQYRNALSRVR